MRIRSSGPLSARALFDILAPHKQKEEQMMYPMLDAAVGEGVPALLEQVKAMAD